LEISPGAWICGALQLKSSVELYLAQGTRLCASDDSELYRSEGGNDRR